MADENENEVTEDNDGAKPDELGEAGQKALAAERKARRTAEGQLRELQTRLKGIEDKDKSDLERLQGQVADLTERAEKAEATAHRFEVAADKGLSPAQARRLVGATKDELEADADAMRSELGLDKDEKDGKSDEGTGKPREQLRSGASNEADEEPDAGKLADSILSSGF